MLNIIEKNKIFIIEILDPRDPQDEIIFLEFINNVFENKEFGLVLNVDGKKAFSQEAKVEFNHWFKNNKLRLKKQCFGFSRVSSNATKMAKLKSKALRLAMPCPYNVSDNMGESLDWLNKQQIK